MDTRHDAAFASDPAATRGFREDARRWLRRRVPDPLVGSVPGHDGYEQRRQWQRALFEAGWAGIDWPTAHGGLGRSTDDSLAFVEEAGHAGAPEPLNLIGLTIIGPTILDVGTDEQRARHLPPMLRGDTVWCQGFSEPEAGSDIAALRTLARPDGDDWVIDGQKVWTSYADVADWCLLLARSDASATGRRGLTAFLVDMAAPGIEVRPIRHMTGDAEFNEVHFDGVRVPGGDRLGDVGGGWGVAITTLLHERRNVGIAFLGQLLAQFTRLRRLADAVGSSESRRAVAGFAAEVEAYRATVRRVLADEQGRSRPTAESAILKLHWSELNQALAACGWDLCMSAEAELAGVAEGAGTPTAEAELAGMGEAAGAAEQESVAERAAGHRRARVPDRVRAYWEHEMLRSRANSIEAGTSEVILSVLAERVLELPRTR